MMQAEPDIDPTVLLAACDTSRHGTLVHFRANIIALP
jgi:hypothetical protein